MKKILMPILLIAHYLNPLLAQIQKGSWMIGGSIGINQQLAPFRLWTNPKVGYFITDWLAVGAAVHFEFTEPTANLPFATRSMNTQMLPFARFYFTPAHRFKFFNEIEAEWYSDYTKIVNSPFPFVDKSWSQHRKFWFRNRFGLNYFLSENIAFEVQLPYTCYYKEDSISYFQPKKEFSFPNFTFNPIFRMRLFLNTTKQGGDVLAEKYLKKGNTTYGLQGNISLAANSLSSFVPNIGYFITDKCMIGSKLWIYIPDKGDISANIGPEIRFYQPISPTTQWLTQASTQLGLFGGFKSSYSQIGTGLNRFIAENISIECLLNGDMFFWNDKFNFEPNFSIGFQYFMSKK